MWWMSKWILGNGLKPGGLRGLSDYCGLKTTPHLLRQRLCKPDSAHADMSSDSWWAADSHLLIGFTNEVSDANKHLWNPTPVTRSTASICGNLSSSCKRVYNHRSDHVPPWAIPLITYLAKADPPSLLWSHWSISPGKERPSKHKTASRGGDNIYCSGGQYEPAGPCQPTGWYHPPALGQ